MFKIEWDSNYFDTYEEAADAIMEDFDMTDFIECGELTDYDKITDMLQELARLGSPLYDSLISDAFNAFCKEWIHEVEEEDDEEEED